MVLIDRTSKSTFSNNGAATARFIANNMEDGYYDIYTYYPRYANGSKHLTYRVYDGKEMIENVLDLSNIEIKGQTSSTWVSLGRYKINPDGGAAYVELSNEGADGVVVANAVLFVPEDDQ